jgi:predicted O-methyltransferase YrrM
LLRDLVQSLLHRYGLSLHRKSSIDSLLRENDQLRRKISLLQVPASMQETEPARPKVTRDREPLSASKLAYEYQQLRDELQRHQDRQILYATTEDYHAHDKMRRMVAAIPEFGRVDFAELSCWLFAASLNNHRVVHQRIDEGSLLWRAVKMSGGPILEVGRAAGGSTLVLLGASGARPVVSIDRAPFHAFIAEDVFKRPDVAQRLKLYVQTSREPIAETEFGMLFIDADHSYEGICHDIGTFWNTLKSFDGKPPLAAFHDAADNPITFVEPVKQACEELLAEPGAARVVESWGSMLILEKTGDIGPDRWFKKEHHAFWEQFADSKYPVLKPQLLRGQLRSGFSSPKTLPVNLLGDENVEHSSWVKRGVTIERLQLNEDNPLRLVREIGQPGEHGIEKSAALNLSRFKFSVYLRPHRLKTIRLAVLSERDRSPLASADFELAERSRIVSSFAGDGIEVVDAAFIYRNGYFGCELSVALPAQTESAIFAVSAVGGASGDAVYEGNSERGFFINLCSVRETIDGSIQPR